MNLGESIRVDKASFIIDGQEEYIVQLEWRFDLTYVCPILDIEISRHIPTDVEGNTTRSTIIKSCYIKAISFEVSEHDHNKYLRMELISIG